MRWGNELVMSAHEGPKSQLPSHEAPRASPREHWGMYSKKSSSPLQLSLLEDLNSGHTALTYNKYLLYVSFYIGSLNT